MEKFKIGDKAIIVHSGNVYGNYNDFYNEHKTNECFPFKGYRRGQANNGTEGVIMAFAKHPNNGRMLYLLNSESDNECIIISESGIESVTGSEINYNG